jgi:RNA polymerase sigma factor for flagellar operon FliA
MDEAVREFEASYGRAPQSEELAAALGIDLEAFWRWKEEVEGGILVAFDSKPAHHSGETTSLEEIIGDESLPEPTEAITREEDVDAVRDAIAELPSRERTVLALYYYEELNLRQIAEVLHLTESRISQIRTQALKRLRERFSGEVFV